MTTAERREKIKEMLLSATSAVSASALAKEFGVSRQAIVGDIALLRASGCNVVSTSRGYVIFKEVGIKRTIVCKHSAEETRDELYAIVDSGCEVIDVIVDHPIYGELAGALQLSSRYDVDQFVQQLSDTCARPLSLLTEGIHLHTLSCPGEEAFEHMKKRLSDMGMLITE